MTQAKTATASDVQEAEKTIQAMLGGQVRVTMSDGRVMEGIFECIDQGMNAIVRDNRLGLVMVPGQHVAKFEVQEK
eukprot:CAMPEP_0171489374 /NCGR_PEP_ID=MMETSP0958-20121227/2722_1 /TAXON_ID=87120 /ORGANISM="Aurantiochytrium limacinum, Strain ATCCMYA-1381" /LENGTH=75 /DNA_ID=CAMNT_0012022581 /DNA_START=158 /DNA_END=385 /DNA_ORIENTATION=-